MMSNGIHGKLSRLALRDGEVDAVDGMASAALRAQLQRIIECPEFDASDRNRRFLQYVVDETLAGRAERIKAYSIATSAFGRDACFDPATDPIIRIEASRLRRSLERYYLTAGQRDSIRIEIPKGSYVPTFRAATADQPISGLPIPQSIEIASVIAGSSTTIADTTNNRWFFARRLAAPVSLVGVLLLAWLGTSWSGQLPPFTAQRQAAAVTDGVPAIFVAPFDNDGGNASDDGLIRGFTREVIVGLVRSDRFSVYGPETSFRHGTDSDPNPAGDSQVELTLTGGVTVSESRFRVAVLLTDARTGRNLWSSIFERDITARNAREARAAIAGQIAIIVGRTEAAILSRRSTAGSPKDSACRIQEAEALPNELTLGP